MELCILPSVLGFIGVIVSCVELICCSFFSSCIFAFIFFFAATGTQMGIFGMFASPGWCADQETSECYDNHVNSETFWMLLLSGFFFFISSLLVSEMTKEAWCTSNSLFPHCVIHVVVVRARSYAVYLGQTHVSKVAAHRSMKLLLS
jgi:hypothetical protein